MDSISHVVEVVSQGYATLREETDFEIGSVDSSVWLSVVLHQVLGSASYYQCICFVSNHASHDINPSNVSGDHRGMKEDLHLHGNQINYITAVFWASYCTSMIPACYLLTRTRINIALPTLEVGWGLFTFGCAWAQNLNTIYAMRFFVGICESCSFTGVIYVIGSWYKPTEITRRVAFFYIASPLGTMFAGYLQAAVYTNLDNSHGLEGWR